MIGDVGVQIALAGPVAAAIVALALAEDKGKYVFTSLLLLLSAAGAATAGFESSVGNPAEWRGFEASAFRAFLCCGALLCAAASVPRFKNGFSRSAAAMASGLTAAALFAPDMLWMGLALLVFTFAIAVVVRVDRAAAWHVVPLAISDAFALCGFAIAASHSLQLGSISGGAAWLVLVAGVIRLASTKRLDEPLRPLLHGCARAQGALLILYGVAGSTHRATWLLIFAAAFCALSVLLPRLTMMPVLLAMAGLAVGGTAGLWGFAIVMVAMFALTIVESTGVPETVHAISSFGPAFGSFVGAMLVGTAVMELAAHRERYLWAAVPILAGLIANAIRAWDLEIPNLSKTHFVETYTSIIAFGSLGLIAFAPSIARARGLTQISTSIGITGPIGVMPKASLGYLIAGLAAIGFLLGGVRPRGARVSIPLPMRFDIEGETMRRRDPVLVFAYAMQLVAFAFAMWLFLLAGHHGWL
ncbi:MAG: hypothetical protein ACYDCC_01395 [Actinomycetota bacterium]